MYGKYNMVPSDGLANKFRNDDDKIMIQIFYELYLWVQQPKNDLKLHLYMCVRACVCLCVRCRSCGQKTDAQCHLAITDDGQIVCIQHFSNYLIFWHLPAAREQISTEVRPVKWRKCIVNRNFERERESCGRDKILMMCPTINA